MSPRNPPAGVVPDVQMAIIESDLHHVREQTDRDRRAVAERLNEVRTWRERVELTLATQAASIARVEDILRRLEKGQEEQQMAVKKLAHQHDRIRGALLLAAWAVPVGVGLLETTLRLVLR